MSEQTGEKPWLDFQQIKDQANVEGVLAHYGMLEHLERRGDELSGWCPFGEEHGKADSFAFNVVKKSFQCFACKARGSVLDFVRKYEGSDLRTAATVIQDIMGGIEASPEPRKSRPYGRNPSAPAAHENDVARPQQQARFEVIGWAEAIELVSKHALDPNELIVLKPASER